MFLINLLHVWGSSERQRINNSNKANTYTNIQSLEAIVNPYMTFDKLQNNKIQCVSISENI